MAAALIKATRPGSARRWGPRPDVGVPTVACTVHRAGVSVERKQRHSGDSYNIVGWYDIDAVVRGSWDTVPPRTTAG